MSAIEIISLATKHFSISREDLVCQRRHGHLIFPRHCTMAAIYEHTNLSLRCTGEVFGRVSHKTVLHAIKHVEHRCASYPREKELWESFCAEIEGAKAENRICDVNDIYTEP